MKINNSRTASRRSAKNLKPDVTGTSSTEVYIRDGGLLRKSRIWAERGDFDGAGNVPKNSKNTYWLIGFDTEYASPDTPVSRSDIADGQAKNKVLSYQVWCKVFEEGQPVGGEWGGVIYPADGERFTLAQVLTFAAWKGISTGAVEKLPTSVYLAAHFSRADIPAFADVRQFIRKLSGVRNTFTAIDQTINVAIDFGDGGDAVVLAVKTRDTMLTTPAGSKSLRALGDLVGVPKVTLHEDPVEEKRLKANMLEVLNTAPELFEEYALTDAVICVRYIERLIAESGQLTGSYTPPVTIGGIAMKLLKQFWANAGFDVVKVLGREMVKLKTFEKKLGYYVTRQEAVLTEACHAYETWATEAYHGGRNEQYWFGPSLPDDWTDYDLSGAYPTAMALITMPDWDNAFYTTDLADFTPTTLGVAYVDFAFPKRIRFPTMPVRSDNGLIFPRRGTCACGAPEIALALSLGAEVTIRRGVVVPPLSGGPPVFSTFIQHCIQKRRSYPAGTLAALFWKELGNSTYGKTAQGLREKRVYNIAKGETEPLPPSDITNPYFAAFITSFVRATLGEILNRLPASVTVFSCTTDGFLTNATQEQIDEAQGELCRLFGESRKALTGTFEVLEVKHRCKQLLGWRTRGQATLDAGDGDGEKSIVLAKGGIYTPDHLDDLASRNEFIRDLFFDRTPEHVIRVSSMTGVRDIAEYEADLVDKEVTRRLGMEFDWKRRPVDVGMCPEYNHLQFDTEPWETLQEFQEVRGHWDDDQQSHRFCMKTLDDYRRFATSVITKSALGPNNVAYLKWHQPDLKLLRQRLNWAWRTSSAGLEWRKDGLSAAQFADILAASGVACGRVDVENDTRKGKGEPRRAPATPDVLAAIDALKATFPTLDASELLTGAASAIDLMSAIHEAR